MIRAWCAAALLLAAMEVRADAAIKAQEGEIKHWIEYYEKQRGAAAVVLPQEEREKKKGRYEVKGKRGK